MKVTKKQIKKAFLKWITDVRLNPSEFSTIEEQNKRSAEEEAKINSEYFIKLLKDE